MPRTKKTTPVSEVQQPIKATKSKRVQSVARLAKKPSLPKSPTVLPEPTKPAATKTSQILALLQLPQGASLAELQTATGWQAHSVRGFLSGTVRTRLGLVLQVSVTEAGERRYQIAEAV